MTKTHANKPTRVVVVNDEKVGNEDNNDEENDTHSEIVATMPKSLQLKARILFSTIGSLVKTGVVESKASHNASAVHGSGRHLDLRSRRRRSRLAIVVVVVVVG